MTTTTDVPQGDLVTVEFARTFAADFLAAWNSHDTERVTAVCDPGIHWEDPFIDGGSLDGHEQLRRWARQAWRSMPDLTFTLDGVPHLAADGRSVMLATTATATMTGPLVPPGFAPTGRRITFSGVDTHWYRDGLLVRARTVSDPMAVARQIGAAPEPGSLAERAGVAVQRLAAWRIRRAVRRAAGRTPGPA